MRIVLGLVDKNAYNGSYRTNPFYFKHHNFTQVGVCVDGEQIPRKPLFLNFDAAGGQNVIAGYQSLPVSGMVLSLITALVTPYSHLIWPQITAREIIFSLYNKETCAWSFISRKHSPTRLTLSSTLNFKTWLRSTQTETFSTSTQITNGHHSTNPYFERG